MFETSKDIFWVVLAFCIAWFTLGLFWVLYYIAQILKNVNQAMTSVRTKLELLENLLKTLKEKIEKSSSHLALLAEGVAQAVGIIKDRIEKKKSVGKTKVKK